MTTFKSKFAERAVYVDGRLLISGDVVRVNVPGYSGQAGKFKGRARDGKLVVGMNVGEYRLHERIRNCGADVAVDLQASRDSLVPN